MLLPVWALMLALSSCEGDVYIYSGTEEFVAGSWQVGDVRPYSGECPYYPGDLMVFGRDGEYQCIGSNGFSEWGIWGVQSKRLYVDFDDDGYAEVEAKIRDINSGYMNLFVKDYTYMSEYELMLVRY